MVQLKHILIQLAWLVLTLFFSILIILIFWEWNFQYHFITVKILHTSVGFSVLGLILSAWLMVSCVIFSIKEFWTRQNSIVGKSIAIIAGISFIISMNYLDAGWTSYPPLEAFGQKQLTFEIFKQGILILQIISGVFMAILLFWWIQKTCTAANIALPPAWLLQI